MTQERKFKYDSLSRLTHEKQVEANATLDINGVYGAIDPVNKWTKVLKYDAFGRLTEGTDARGVKTNFVEYDTLNRIKRITFSDGTPQVTYTYDQARSGFYNYGALTRVETAAGVAPARPDTPATATEFDYDLMGRVVKHRQSIDTQTYALEYGYNLAGQLTSEKYPSGKIVTNSYDANGRLSGISDASRTYLSGLQYQGLGGALSSMSFGNGTTQTFSMNDRLQMTNQTLSKGSEVLQKYDYSYGTVDLASGTVDATKNNGQLGKIEGWIGANKQWSQRFGYDELGRLSEAREYKQGDNAQLTYKQKFDFDRFGNMYRKVTSNPTTGQQNPLPYNPVETADISKSTNRFTSNTTYDDAGNVTTDNKFRTMGFGYDADGRMVKATKTSVPDAASVYNAGGLRVAEKVNDVWRFLVYDIGGKLVAEYGGLQGTDEGGVKYLLSDWQGSTRAVLSNSGYVNARSDYTAYGEEISSGTGLRTAAQGFGTANNLRQKYGLTERDDATGLDHTWFRKNENRAGRWTSPDPYNGSMSIGNPQSFNRYSYVENEPTNFVDPSGLLRVWSCSRIWFDTAAGRVYLDWICTLIYDDGGGGSVGSGGDCPPGYVCDEFGNMYPVGRSDPGDCGNGNLAVSASAKGNAVVYGFSNGAQETREGGSRSWRNNNPGNLRSSQAQIGRAGGFAVFGSEIAGTAGQAALLGQPRYQSQTVAGAIAVWAPPKENDTARYQAFVANRTGLNLQTPMSALSSSQLSSMMNAMRTHEGWRVGRTIC